MNEPTPSMVENIPDKGEELVLVPISNMSAGGTSIDVTDTVNTHWVDLANNIASNFGLRFCGLDIGCNDISNATSEYSVLEVNSKPGIKHYASSGNAQRLICDNLYKKIFNTMTLNTK